MNKLAIIATIAFALAVATPPVAAQQPPSSGFIPSTTPQGQTCEKLFAIYKQHLANISNNDLPRLGPAEVSSARSRFLAEEARSLAVLASCPMRPFGTLFIELNEP